MKFTTCTDILEAKRSLSEITDIEAKSIAFYVCALLTEDVTISRNDGNIIVKIMAQSVSRKVKALVFFNEEMVIIQGKRTKWGERHLRARLKNMGFEKNNNQS